MKIGDVVVCVDDHFRPSEFLFIPNRRGPGARLRPCGESHGL